MINILGHTDNKCLELSNYLDQWAFKFIGFLDTYNRQTWICWEPNYKIG